MKKTLINLVVIAGFAFSFYALALVINLLAAGESGDQSAFSFLKRTADKHWRDKNYSEAGRYYKELAESDPFNGNARLVYSECLLVEIRNKLAELKTKKEGIQRLEKEVRPQIDQAIDSYEKTLEFPQFRNIARIRLALLNGYLGNQEASLEVFLAALRDGWRSNNRGAYADFYEFNSDFLLEHPEFLESKQLDPRRGR